jgi:hypothetical protein
MTKYMMIDEDGNFYVIQNTPGFLKEFNKKKKLNNLIRIQEEALATHDALLSLLEKGYVDCTGDPAEENACFEKVRALVLLLKDHRSKIDSITPTGKEI